MLGARTKRIKRITSGQCGSDVQAWYDELSEFTEDHDTDCGERPVWHENRARELSVYLATPMMRTRDSEALDVSNWETTLKLMGEEVPQWGTHSNSESFEVKSFGHWAFGWYERLYVRRDDVKAISVIGGILDNLQDYPVLDESDYSQREWDQNHPSTGQCYAEDCSCETGKHDRMNNDDPDGEAGCRDWFENDENSYGKGGWRTFEASDVDELKTYYDEFDSPMHARDELIGTDRHGIYSDLPSQERIIRYEWYCGHDHCGNWVEAFRSERVTLRRHRLFSDLPTGPLVSLVKGARQMILGE